MKIIGVGLSKTGTASLAAALRAIGFSCVHSAHPHLLEEADALVDTPAAARYRELDVIYPGSKFILTTREQQGWLESCRLHWQRFSLQVWPPEVRFEYAWCRVRLFGRLDFDADNHWQAYLRHRDGVRAYFADRPGDLLEMDITRGDGWEMLCPFLNVAIPRESFPWSNRAPNSDASTAR